MTINHTNNINELTSDYKVEQVAARLLELLGTLDHIIINRKNYGSRPHHKDIIRLYNDTSEFDLSTLWIIDTHKMGLYEALPENIFYEPALGSLTSSEEEVIEQIRKRREEEKNAQQFFAPFEQELSYLGVVMHYVENELGRVVSTEVINVFAVYWPFLKRIDKVSAMIFLHILPFLQKVRGDFRWMEKYLSLFTGAPVHIKEEVNQIVPPEHGNSYYILGQQNLGEDMLLSGSFYDGETDIVIEIGPVNADKIKNYTPGARFNNILQEIYSFFMPVNKRFRQHVFVEETDRCFELGKESHLTLGYDTYL